MNVFLLSHNDMDGYGCNLTVKRAYPEARTLNIGYGVIVDTLQYLDKEMSISRFDHVYVTDLNFDEVCTIELFKVVKHHPTTQFTYIDHHPYKNERQSRIFDKMKELGNFDFVHTEKYSATFIFYKYMLKKGLITTNDDYDKLMHMIDSYDTWKKDSDTFKAGMALNDVFYEWTRERFLGYMTEHMKITPEIKNIMKDLTVRKNTWFKQLEERGFIRPFGNTLMVLSDNFISHMTVDYPGYKYYVNGRSYGGVSVRISEDVPNPGEISDRIINLMSTNPWVVSTGGHERAFGITLNGTNKDKMIPIVEIVVKELVNL